MKKILLSLAVLCAAASLRADIVLPALFSDHAVLQKSNNVPVWGKASPGEPVKVTLDKVSASAVAGADGKWKVALDLSSLGPGPFELVVQGKNSLTVKDVLVGEVWLCGGQSNMEWPLRASKGAAEEIARSANPLLRQFKVDRAPSPVLLDEAKGKWVVATEASTPDFSAAGYFFGKALQNELKVPVGLLNDSMGGTVIETWMSAEALAADPELKAGAEKARNDRQAFDEYAEKYRAWQKQFDRLDRPTANPEAFTGADVDTADWKPVTMPGLFSAAGLPDAGAVWIRRKFPVPSKPDIFVNKGIDLYLGNVRDSNTVFWNGRKIGESDITAVDHRYGIRFNFVIEGENVLAARIFNPATGAGIEPGNPRFQGNHFMLAGEWLAKAEFALPPLDDAAKQALPPRPAVPIEPQNVASYLFNGMINPVIPYAIQGAIWYQGEGNWQRGFQYRTAFPSLIKDWRAKWGRGDFPFYFCQIANLGVHSLKPEESPFAEVREAQSMTLSLRKTGQAVLIDIGEEGNIHPADKQSVGDRLARIALADTYGKSIAFSGPVYDSMAAEGNKVRLRFKHAEGGLVAKPLPEAYQPLSTDPKTVPLVRNSPGGELEGFTVCGLDHKWSWATAKIDGDAVVVWSDAVPEPVAVRYAWAQNPFCNLYNAAGLPASPFRTDDFPVTSAKNKY